MAGEFEDVLGGFTSSHHIVYVLPFLVSIYFIEFAKTLMITSMRQPRSLSRHLFFTYTIIGGSAMFYCIMNRFRSLECGSEINEKLKLASVVPDSLDPA